MRVLTRIMILALLAALGCLADGASKSDLAPEPVPPNPEKDDYACAVQDLPLLVSRSGVGQGPDLLLARSTTDGLSLDPSFEVKKWSMCEQCPLPGLNTSKLSPFDMDAISWGLDWIPLDTYDPENADGKLSSFEDADPTEPGWGAIFYVDDMDGRLYVYGWSEPPIVGIGNDISELPDSAQPTVPIDAIDYNAWMLAGEDLSLCFTLDGDADVLPELLFSREDGHNSDGTDGATLWMTRAVEGPPGTWGWSPATVIAIKNAAGDGPGNLFPDSGVHTEIDALAWDRDHGLLVYSLGGSDEVAPLYAVFVEETRDPGGALTGLRVLAPALPLRDPVGNIVLKGTRVSSACGEDPRHFKRRIPPRAGR